MSVGGRVIEVVAVSPDKVWVNTQDRGPHKDECAVICNPAGNEIKVGDSLWWQGGVCFWTPRVGGEAVPPFERELKKLGYSGVPRPSLRPSLHHEKQKTLPTRE